MEQRWNAGRTSRFRRQRPSDQFRRVEDRGRRLDLVSVPAWCTFDMRIGLYPGHGPGRRARARSSRPSPTRRARTPSSPTARRRSSITASRPKVMCWSAGTAAEKLLELPSGGVTASELGRAHRHRHDRCALLRPLCRHPGAWSTDRRPTTSTPSTSAWISSRSALTTQAIALFIADWCGVKAA